jgi:hypothetical protein
MPLSWNEIRHNAIRFARNHNDTASEQGEHQTFWNDERMHHYQRRRASITGLGL